MTFVASHGGDGESEHGGGCNLRSKKARVATVTDVTNVTLHYRLQRRAEVCDGLYRAEVGGG